MAGSASRRRRARVLTAGLLAASLPAWADMYPDASNAVLPAASANLGIAASLLAFGAKCDGVADDAAAFAAASAWLAGAAQRLVSVPAGICLTSAPVTVGDGRQQSTVLTGAASGSSLSVASCTGVVAGDAVALRRDDGSFWQGVASACAGTVLSLNGAYAGGAASSGAVVFTGRVSSYTGGGFVGYGACMTSGIAALPSTSTIRYTGPAAPGTVLSGAASAGAVTLSVADATGIAVGDALRLVLDSGATFWTHAIETPSGGAVKIANEVPSLASSGNAVVIANNPVVRVRGWALSPVVKNLCLDANNLAAAGLEAVSAYRGDFRGLTAWKYTGVGHYLHTTEAYIGISSGSADNDFELYALLPANNRTIGLWINGAARGNVGFSRNRFWGGNLNAGGFDAAAASVREEFVDNNIFIKAYTSRPNPTDVAGAGLYRVPSFYQTYNFPLENTFLGPALIGNVVNGTATGKSVGVDHAAAYATSDGEVVPTAGMVGSTAAGKRFPDPYAFAATVLSPAGTATTASYVMMGLGGAYTPNSSGTIEVTVSGMVTSSVVGNGINFYIARGAGAVAPVNGAAAAGASCSQVYSYAAIAAGTPGRVPFSATCIASGLALGTAYWLDLAFQAVTGGTASASGVRIAVKEL